MPAAADHDGRIIYIARPATGDGGRADEAADDLIRAQATDAGPDAAELLALDTRGPGKALRRAARTLSAIGRIARARLGGRLAGVHVNVAGRPALVRDTAVVAACHVLGVPVIVHVHDPMREAIESLAQPLRQLARWTFSLADGVAVTGADSRAFAIDELGVPARRVDIVFEGVSGPQTTPDILPERKVRHALFVGPMDDDAGVTDLLQAIAATGLDASRIRLTLAGEGDTARYIARAEALGVASMVHFAGPCDAAQMRALLDDADLLVEPSRDGNLPLVVLEALARCVPIVCTPAGELPAMLSDGENALIVPARDPDALGATIARAVEDRPLCEWIALNGRALYERQFSVARFFGAVARIHTRHFGVAARPLRSADRETSR